MAAVPSASPQQWARCWGGTDVATLCRRAETLPWSSKWGLKRFCPVTASTGGTKPQQWPHRATAQGVPSGGGAAKPEPHGGWWGHRVAE